LHAKKYDEANDIWQARVNRSWRFYFVVRGDEYVILSIIRRPKQETALKLPRLYYSDHLLNSSAPLVPPKPKEFDIAYSSLALRA
jgi:hypothetical protein